MSLALYHEARSEPIETQVAIANVIMNRSKKDKKTVCEVTKAPGQFSWMKDAKKRSITSENQIKDKIERKAFLRAKYISSLALNNKLENTIGQRRFFSLSRMYKTSYNPIKKGKTWFY